MCCGSYNEHGSAFVFVKYGFIRFRKVSNCICLISSIQLHELTMYILAFTGKFVYMAHHYILLPLNPFDLRVNREGWWFEHSMS